MKVLGALTLHEIGNLRNFGNSERSVISQAPRSWIGAAARLPLMVTKRSLLQAASVTVEVTASLGFLVVARACRRSVAEVTEVTDSAGW